MPDTIKGLQETIKKKCQTKRDFSDGGLSRSAAPRGTQNTDTNCNQDTLWL